MDTLQPKPQQRHPRRAQLRRYGRAQPARMDFAPHYSRHAQRQTAKPQRPRQNRQLLAPTADCQHRRQPRHMAHHRAHPATHPARPHPARHRPCLPQPTLRSPRPTHPARPTARARQQTTTNPTAPRLRRRHALFTAQSSGQRYPNNTGSLKSIARQNNNDTNRAYSSATHTVCKISTTQARVRAYGTHPTRRLNQTFLDLLRHKIAQ